MVIMVINAAHVVMAVAAVVVVVVVVVPGVEKCMRRVRGNALEFSARRKTAIDRSKARSSASRELPPALHDRWIRAEDCALRS